jgi:AcrR family transcriptional regulator
MGVSEAALYRYVESKEGLFRLVIRQALLLENPPEEALPLASPPLEVTIKEIHDVLRAGAAPTALLDEALRRSRVRDAAAEFEGIVRELYALIRLTGRAMDMIERSARDSAEFAQLVDVELRRPLIDALATYLARRARQGHLRRTADSHVTARVVLETIVWAARHRFSDADGEAISDEAAEVAVLDLVRHGLTPVAR